MGITPPKEWKQTSKWKEPPKLAKTRLDHFQFLLTLLPPGQIWDHQRVFRVKDGMLEGGTVLQRLLWAWANELYLVDQKVDDLAKESDPRTAVATLDDWERITGLPDECLPASDLVAQRQNAIVNRIGSLGGQSAPYYIAAAIMLGFVDALGECLITITDRRPFYVGEAYVGLPLYNEDWRHICDVEGAEQIVTKFRVGQGRCGDPLVVYAGDEFYCWMNQRKPAHVGPFYENSNVVTNSEFVKDEYWTKGTGWTIANGVAHKAAGTASDLSQDIGSVSGNTYRVQFKVDNRTAGTVSVKLGGVTVKAVSADGEYDELIVGGASDNYILFAADSSFVGDIDNVYVRRW
jgi:uncharacterized protein YmfQ (DUF2313 family)